jgi:glutamyl-tRNA synthetase
VTAPAFKTRRYRGRLAPSPTGYLHLGHARTFWIAQGRVEENQGVLVLRNEDLDPDRCKPEFAAALIEDLRWFGFHWQEGPDCGGPFGPYVQSERRIFYAAAFQSLYERGLIYPCACSRRDVQRASQAPHLGDEEAIYPGTCRPLKSFEFRIPDSEVWKPAIQPRREAPRAHRRINWRFRVPEGEAIRFTDGGRGEQSFIAGKDFGDWVIWRHDDVPAYQLAAVVDDAAMRISEVVRGEDLLASTARQILLYHSLGLTPPDFFHCPLMTDDHGARLAKRHDALSLRTLRAGGQTPGEIRSLRSFQAR